MTEELRKALTFIFRTKGLRQVGEDALRDMLSFDLRWFSPDDSRKFIAAAVDKLLLTSSSGMLALNFDAGKVEIPLSYKPPADMLAPQPGNSGQPAGDRKEQKSLFITIIERMEKVTTLSREQLMARINGVQAGMDIDIEVAALIVASDFDMDIKPIAKIVEEEIISRYGENR